MKIILSALFFIPLAYAQQLQPVTSVQADCGKFSSPIRVAGTVTTAIVDNRQAGCDGWAVTYSSNGFATVSVLLQSAPLGVGGIAGTFVNFAGTIVTGFVNPTTATTQGESRATGYFPYVRLQITTTGAGYLQAEFHGFKNNPNSGSGAPSSSGGCVGTSATPCVVDGPTADGALVTKPPVLVAGSDGSFGAGVTHTLRTDVNGGLTAASIAAGTSDGVTDVNISPPLTSGVAYLYNLAIPYLFNGSTWDRGFICTNRALVTLTDATRTQIIAASGSTSIRICHIHFSTSGAAEEFTISTGTGANCVTGPVVIDDYLATTAIAMDFQPTAALRGAASQAVCVTQSGAAQTAKVIAVYARF